MQADGLASSDHASTRWPQYGLSLRPRFPCESTPAALAAPWDRRLALVMRRPVRAAAIGSVTLQRPAQPKHRVPLPLQAPASHWVAGVKFEADHRHRPVVCEVRGLGLAPAPRRHHITAGGGGGVSARGSHGTHASTAHRQILSPHRRRNLLSLTGLTRVQIRTIDTTTRQRPANLTTRALAVLLHTSQSRVDRTIDHLVPVLADALRPAPEDTSTHPWIIDATPIPVHDQSMNAISKNYRRNINTQIIIWRSPAPCRGNRALLTRQPQRRHRGPPHRGAAARRSCRPRRPSATAASPPSPHPDAIPLARSPAMTTTAHTTESEPASNTSSPDSKPGNYCDNAAAAPRPSTTASKSSPDSGISKPTGNYGSTLSPTTRKDTSAEQTQMATISPRNVAFCVCSRLRVRRRRQVEARAGGVGDRGQPAVGRVLGAADDAAAVVDD